MAHMLFAGRSSRGLGFLGCRASWNVGCKQNLFVVGRIHPSILRAFPRCFTDENKEAEAEAQGEAVSIDIAKSGGQLESLASQDVTHEATQEDHTTTDASATTPEEPVESTKSCTAAANKGEEGNNEEDNFRTKMDQLRELKRQMEELDKEYDSYFTVDYALKFAKKGFKDSDDEEYVDSSDTDKSSLEISGPGEISSSEDDEYNR